MGWNYWHIPDLQRCNRWSLGMDKQFQFTLYNGCGYLSILGLKLYPDSKRGPEILHRWYCAGSTRTDLFMMTSSNRSIFRVTGPLCGEFTGPRWIPPQRPVTRSFDVFFDLRLNKRLSKQSWGWWLETPPRPLRRHCNVHEEGYLHHFSVKKW